MEAAMSSSPSLIMIQFLAWVEDRPRTREEAVEAWHSCPHISVWEDAVVDGLVRTENDGHRTITLTRHGRAMLEQAGKFNVAIDALCTVKSAPRRLAAAALRRR
jgi:hypothetical protein